MASPSPPVLPVSTAQPITTTTALPSPPPSTTIAVQSDPPVQTPAFRTFINNTTESIRNNFSQRRPWAELVDRSAFSKPDSLTEATFRVRKNYAYFRVNYLSLLAGVLAFSLVTNPSSLLIFFGLLSAWVFLYLFRPSDPPLVMFGRTFAEHETLGLLILLSIVVIFLTSVGSVLVSALMAGVAIVCIHGAFRTPDDLVLDEPQPAPTGFLSFLGGAPSNSSTVAPSNSSTGVPAPTVAASI